ncbi:hypothetical protein DMB85_020790 [Pectobacterium aquaticum]|uniref:Uncharacterized protein n=1 Tax=Pectobacterium aquaticum TaxID=2204145 RepID=A0A3R8NGN3_9GAMM|nr:hypothetical protein DMB85_020790 [Pectobacterium aquaticum]
MGKGTKGGSGKSQGSFSWAQAWRDVMYKAISSGQIVPTSIAIVAMIGMWRMPTEQIGPLMHRVLNGLSNHSITGWVMFAMALCAWCWHSATMRKNFSLEAQRIGNEKTRHQQARTDQPLGTSDSR